MPAVLYYRDLEERGHGTRWTIRRKVEAGLLPKPRDLGNGRPFWLLSEIEEVERGARECNFGRDREATQRVEVA